MSIGSLAYASADVAHHLLGHVTACLLSGGQVRLATSQVVLCTVTGSTVDLAGPFASLAVGLTALLAVRFAGVTSSPMRLFLALVAAFNLFWFNLQMAYSAVTMQDDWAWALKEISKPIMARCLLIALGLLGYRFTVRVIARNLKNFSAPKQRLRTICGSSWLAAGTLACLTATLDHNPARALKRALPQAMFLSLGLLVLPSAASRRPDDGLREPPILLSWSWIITAVLVSVLSMVYLGPGVSLYSRPAF